MRPATRSVDISKPTRLIHHAHSPATKFPRVLGKVEFTRAAGGIALKADPNHVLTWLYYGLWQIEQGNRDQAQYHLSRIAATCGADCEEYRSFAAALE